MAVSRFGFQLDPSTDTGLVGDGITSGKALKLSGYGTPGGSITILAVRSDGWVKVLRASVRADGTFAIEGINLPDGTYTLRAGAVDAAGPVAFTLPKPLVVDSTPPAAPTFSTLASTTTDTHPLLAGKAEANAKVMIYLDGSTAPVATVLADAKGQWSYKVGQDLSPAQHQFSARAADAAGNISAASATATISVQAPVVATAPAKPVPVLTTPAPATVATPVVAAFADPLTNVTKPVVKGTAPANSTVAVYVDGATKAIGTVKADAQGNWAFTLPGALADGLHAFRATAADNAGHVSSLSAARSLTIDATPPAAPVVAAFGAVPIASVLPAISGTAEANATVTVYLDGKAIGTTKAGATGAWSFTPSTALADGAHSVAASARDAAGNTGALSAAAALTVDHTAPLAPKIQAFGTALTSNVVPAVSGTAEANASVTVYVDGKAVGTTKAASTGAWSLVPSVALSDGAHSFTANARDAAGNVGSLSAAVALTIDHAGPAAPVIAAFGAAVTSSQTPGLAGKAEANATVSLYLDGSVTPFGTVKADGSGNWAYVPASAIADGLHRFTARATDAAGNASALSQQVSVTIDHLAPAAPIIAAFGQSMTSDATPTIQGSAEAGATVAIMADGASTAMARVVADGSGHWAIDLPLLADGTHSFRATATDAAGNVSLASGSQSVTIDTHAPTALVSSLVVAGDNVISAAEAAASSLHVTGTLSQALQAGDSLLITMAGATYTVASSAIVGGAFSLDVTKPAGGWAAGTATAHVEDAAHNAAATTSDAYTMAPATPASTGFLMGVNIAGGEFGSVGGAYGWNYIYPSHGEIDYYDSKGMDVIRVPFLWDRVQATPFAKLDATELARLDDAVNYATAHGLKVVLDPHNYGYGPAGLIGATDTSNAAFADFWGQMAAHYAGNKDVIFGLMNEPHEQSAASWLVSVNAAIAAIRNAGATNEILVPGTHWDGAWTWTTSDNASVIGTGVKDPLHNFAFEVHQYLDTWASGTQSTVVSTTVGVERLTAITQWAEATGNKLFLGEFGVASDQTSLTALDKMLAYMEQHTDAWQGGTYWAGGAWWGNYMYSVEPNAAGDKPQMAILQQHANQVI